MVSILDKFKGALLGCAVGDALGMPVEGMDARTITERYGRVTDFIDERFGRGRLTDDTQMTITLAQSIIEIGKYQRAHAAFKFARWIEASDAGIKEARGIGAASMAATRSLAKGADPSTSGVDSAGCGAAMRAGPIGLRYFCDPRALYDAAADQATITHTDARAIAGSIAVAMAVAQCINDDKDLDRAQFVLRLADSVSLVSPLMSARIAGLADLLDASPEEGFSYTGNGGVATETVPAALFAFLRSPCDLEETLLTAVNAGGDTDSIGAIAGVVSGSFNGVSAIPQRWSGSVEGGRYVQGLAYRLFTLTPACKAAARPLV